MAAKIATDEAVFAAADAAVAEGIEPTLKLLQERTGGSYTTVNKAFSRWKEQRASEQAYEPAPAEITGKVDQLMRTIWSTAREKAQQRLEEIRRAADLTVQTIRSELAHAQEQIGRLEAELASTGQQLQDSRAALEQERSHMHSQALLIQQLEAECARCARSLAGTRRDGEQHLARAANLEAQCAALSGQIADLLNALHTASTLSKESKLPS